MNKEKYLTVQSSINNSMLQQLFNEEVCALHVESYVSKDLCSLLYNNLLNDIENIEPHPHEIRHEGKVQYIDYGVDRIGLSYHTTYNKPSDSFEYKHYYENTNLCMLKLRSACYPYQYPMDKFRIEMDENWTHKVNLAAFDGMKMFCGIVRIMNSAKSFMVESQPHFDSLPDRADKLKAQYSVNIYIAAPEIKGELELWDVPALTNMDIDNFDTRINRDWRSELPESFLIKPETGDLIIFNTRKPHAIRSFDNGKRVSIQSFVGLHDNNDISIWT